MHNNQNRESLGTISEQIGLISVTNGADLRYLGPSSGLFFTKFVLAGLGKRILSVPDRTSAPEFAHNSIFVPSDLLAPHQKGLPADERQARWLSQAYFEHVHLQFPLLHESTHWETVSRAYGAAEIFSVDKFQVFMVLAIGAAHLSRRTKVALSAEGYYFSATKLVDEILKTSSIASVQCILLLEIYAFNNPSSGLSLWSLHHHGLALAIELGLHRNVPESTFSTFERELRTRVFWCTYTIDRLLSTLMGRPMGVVDEQCELRASTLLLSIFQRQCT